VLPSAATSRGVPDEQAVSRPNPTPIAQLAHKGANASQVPAVIIASSLYSDS
jgi:hypothetical protein